MRRLTRTRRHAARCSRFCRTSAADCLGHRVSGGCGRGRRGPGWSPLSRVCAGRPDCGGSRTALSARTRSGRLRGLPGPRRGTRMASRTGSNCGESPRWPAVLTTLSGFCPCSTARWILVVRPPRERPRACSAGSTAMPPGGSFADPLFRGPGGVLVGPADGGVDIHVPGDQALRVRLSLELSDDPAPGAIAPGSTGTGPPPDAVYQLPSRPHRRTARLDALQQQRLKPGPLSIRQITTPQRA